MFRAFFFNYFEIILSDKDDSKIRNIINEINKGEVEFMISLHEYFLYGKNK